MTRESLHLAAGDGTNLEFEIIARVLGKGKGTPMLRYFYNQLFIIIKTI